MGSYKASAKLTMVEEETSRRRLSELFHPSASVTNTINRRLLNADPSSYSTPSELCITIVYAHMVEGTQWSCPPNNASCKTFGPKEGKSDGAAELGDCIYNVNQGITGCTGNNCCLIGVIYENPACCLSGYTPSVDTIDQCTFDSNKDGDCVSECDIYHSEKPSRCSEWPGLGPTATLEHCIDLTQGSDAVNEALGATILPIIKDDPYGSFTELGGKFRGIRVDFGGKTLGDSVPSDMNPNIRFNCSGLTQKEYFWDSSSDIEYYLSPGNEVTINEGDTVVFQLEYNVTDVCHYYDDWEAKLAMDCVECTDPNTNIKYDCNTGSCTTSICNNGSSMAVKDTPTCQRRANGCYPGEYGPHVFPGIVCLEPLSLEMVPGFYKLNSTDSIEGKGISIPN